MSRLATSRLSSGRLGGSRLSGARRALVFNIASLFANGEQGAWYEPSDLATLFQESVGTTPVSEPGDAVALMLDKSKGLTLGPVTEEPFSDWVESNEGTFSATGQFVDTLGGQTRPGAQWTSSLPLGWCQVTLTITEIIGATSVRLDHFGSLDAVQEVGTKTYIFNRNLDLPPRVRLEKIGTEIGDGFTVGELSVRELPGNHATQGTAAARPILRQTAGGLYYLEDDEVDDALNWDAPAETYTISYVNSSGVVTTLADQSLSGATNILLDPALAGYLAIHRALTAGETSNLETYWGTL